MARRLAQRNLMNSFSRELDFLLTDNELFQTQSALPEWKGYHTEISLNDCLYIASLQHFGYLKIDFVSMAKEAIKIALDLADPSRVNDIRLGIWFSLSQFSLPLLLLYGTEEQIQTFVSPYHLKLDPGYTGRFEHNYTRAYLLICNFLKSTPEPDAGLRQELLDCKKKQVVLLVEALLAAVEGTQSDFDRAFTAGMKYFRSRNKTYKDNDKKQFDLIALEYTAVNAIAKRCGKHMTDLPINLACSILTRESIDNPVP